MIREATLADVLQLADMGNRFVRETAYRERMADNPLQRLALYEYLIVHGVIFVVEQGDRLVGMIGMAPVTEHPESKERCTTEIFLWIEPEHRGGLTAARLERYARRWAKDHGAVWMTMIAPADQPRTGLFYQALGYVHIEDVYQIRL